MEGANNDAMDVQQVVVDDNEVNPPPAKVSKLTFKDLSLNTKQLLTRFTDAEENQALIGEEPQEIMNGNNGNENDGRDPLLAFDLFATERKYSEEDVSLARKLLKDSWNKDPDQTFKLIKKIRNVKEGKGLRQLYHICLYWMYQYHPKFLYDSFEGLFGNIGLGYCKDPLEFLMTIAFDGFVPNFLGQDDCGGVSDHDSRKPKSKVLDETNIYNIRVLQNLQLPLTESVNTEKRTKFARNKFENDLKYRFFHIQVAKFFAKGLLKDKLDINHVSYFAKWAPTLEKHHDKYTLISSTIAIELLQLAGTYFYVWTKSLPVAVYLARKIYNKDFCVPLRAQSGIAEVSMSAKKWNEINYDRVPSRAMKRNVRSFDINDKERFATYLKSHTKRTQDLKPLEIIDRVMSISLKDSENYRNMIQRQWMDLVRDIKFSGPAKNSISVVRVKSESDPGSRMLKAALGLMLLTSDINPRKHSYFMSLNGPEIHFHHVQKSESIFEQVGKLKKVSWEGADTTLFDILNQILQGAQEKSLNPNEMFKLVYFFVDDDFNSVFPNASQDLKKATSLFQSKSFEIPGLVFWNLKPSDSHQVYSNDNGVCLLSGFGSGQLKYLVKKTKIDACEMDLGENLSEMSPLEFLHFSLG